MALGPPFFLVVSDVGTGCGEGCELSGQGEKKGVLVIGSGFV